MQKLQDQEPKRTKENQTESRWIVEDELLNGRNSNQTKQEVFQTEIETETKSKPNREMNQTKENQTKIEANWRCRNKNVNQNSEYTNTFYSSVAWLDKDKISNKRCQNQNTKQNFVRTKAY